MQSSNFAKRAGFARRRDEKPRLPQSSTGEVPGGHLSASQPPGGLGNSRIPSVFVFNPFAESYIAQGKNFTPVKHQAMLAADLGNLPQFLCQAEDIVLLAKRPSVGFLKTIEQAGFSLPKFVELSNGRIDPAANLGLLKLRSLRPWAWGPDSVELLGPLFAGLAGEARTAQHYFHADIARIYSKAWSAGFLRKFLARRRGGQACAGGAEALSRPDAAVAADWLCSEQEAGITVDTVHSALEAVAAIRCRGHHRVVVKKALGLAGHNAIRLWESEILPAQRRWLAHALEGGRQLVVEPWLKRELDFSVQLEMGPRGLQLCGYTGMVNDLKGQFLANWAEAGCTRCLPAKVAVLFPAPADISECFQRVYGEIFSWLEPELQRVGFVGPISIDALVYRTPQGHCRLKPIVEINPRYTMGRLTLELMKHACPGSCGLFRLVTLVLARQEGFNALSSYARSLRERLPLRLEREPAPKIRTGILCLNDPVQAQVVLATFAVSPVLNLPGSLGADQHQRLW